MKREVDAASYLQAKSQITIVAVVCLLLVTSNVRGEEALGHAAKKAGTIHTKEFDLPLSSLLAPDERSALEQKKGARESEESCPFRREHPYENVPEQRRCSEKELVQLVEKQKRKFKVTVNDGSIAGVPTETIYPRYGISPNNAHRILINLHGGGFLGGARLISQIESIPIAAVGGIKVISIDYRLAPEFAFPAAVEDAVAVYRRLLNEYRPENIGIFGCSAGGLLTAQTVALLQKRQLPMPGAVGMFCAGGTYWTEGDSGHIVAAIGGGSVATEQGHPYFKDANLSDPLVFPARSKLVMAEFPPSLLITSTRDFALSSVVYTHSLLVKEGVDAELHVWEGLGHAFYFDPELPQSSDVYSVIHRFFDKHLGSKAKGAS